MTLTTTIETNGKATQIDLDTLNRYGQYYIDETRNLIIRAVVYTHGTKDSRWVGKTEVGTDYTISRVPVDRDKIKQYIDEELNLTLTDEEAERIATYYQGEGLKVIKHWMTDLPGDDILGRADKRILSTDVQEPVIYWDSKFEDIVTRATATTERSEHEIKFALLNAARSASPGDYEYSAKVELTGTPA